MLVISILQIASFLLLRLLLTIMKKRPRRTMWLQRQLRLSVKAIPGFLPAVGNIAQPARDAVSVRALQGFGKLALTSACQVWSAMSPRPCWTPHARGVRFPKPYAATSMSRSTWSEAGSLNLGDLRIWLNTTSCPVFAKADGIPRCPD
jgi:hypothetical protein